ncbi:MAG: NAD(P)/FAD-dependent oxidoreductase [Terracidiphilus sp.]|jgi:protoporphyrinogen oxidase
MKTGTAIVIGAGPAGLTAALELQRCSAIKPIVLEASDVMGGLSCTVCWNGNRADFGGHRFFSKSDRVMQWWLEMMPLEEGAADDGTGKHGGLRYQGQHREIPSPNGGHDPHCEDLVMLVRQRRSRIYFLRRFFDYPIRLNAETLRGLGAVRTVRCGLSYLRATIMPRRNERSLEDFLVNRFGEQLYLTFFKPYTEKVWGMPCREISAAWGAQRIKGLSLGAVVRDLFDKAIGRDGGGDLAQKRTETSLIEKFLYPKLGAGQMWEHAAELVIEGGGEIHLGVLVDRIVEEDGRVVAVEGRNRAGDRVRFQGDYFLSTMPVRDLIRAFSCEVPKDVAEVSEGLMYRDFMIVGLLARGLAVHEKDGSPLKDNWIYIHEPDVKVGRIQILNNWSPWLVANPEKAWIALEYFLNESDALWKLPEEEVAQLAIREAVQIGILNAADVEETHVVRVPKAYPAYFGSYDRFDVIRRYTDRIENLFLVGRNGMHKYNNQDHSMLTAMAAVECIVNGVSSKESIWAINTEMEHHEDNRELTRIPAAG